MKLLCLDGAKNKVKTKQSTSMYGKVENILLRIKYYFSAIIDQGLLDKGPLIKSPEALKCVSNYLFN
ncbi:MAG TPA: hypothetical protein VFG46_10245 [Chryseolinea sp.]|nr:hypothetical protein [Chryseolinea sp.]